MNDRDIATIGSSMLALAQALAVVLDRGEFLSAQEKKDLARLCSCLADDLDLAGFSTIYVFPPVGR